jgi:hypothetical protein
VRHKLGAEHYLGQLGAEAVLAEEEKNVMLWLMSWLMLWLKKKKRLGYGLCHGLFYG